MVLSAKNENDMRSMIERLETYLDKKHLKFNADKTKIMRFKRGRGELMKNEWRWKGKGIEEIKEFKYLGYVLERNGDQKAQIINKIKKAAIVMKQVEKKEDLRGLGEKNMAIR